MEPVDYITTVKLTNNVNIDLQFISKKDISVYNNCYFKLKDIYLYEQ